MYYYCYYLQAIVIVNTPFFFFCLIRSTRGDHGNFVLQYIFFFGKLVLQYYMYSFCTSFH